MLGEGCEPVERQNVENKVGLYHTGFFKAGSQMGLVGSYPDYRAREQTW